MAATPLSASKPIPASCIARRDHPVHHLDVSAGGDLRHDPAIGRVRLDLAGDDGGQHLNLVVPHTHYGGSGLIAAGFDAENGQGLIHRAHLTPDAPHCDFVRAPLGLRHDNPVGDRLELG